MLRLPRMPHRLSRQQSPHSQVCSSHSWQATCARGWCSALPCPQGTLYHRHYHASHALPAHFAVAGQYPPGQGASSGCLPFSPGPVQYGLSPHNVRTSCSPCKNAAGQPAAAADSYGAAADADMVAPTQPPELLAVSRMAAAQAAAQAPGSPQASVPSPSVSAPAMGLPVSAPMAPAPNVSDRARLDSSGQAQVGLVSGACRGRPANAVLSYVRVCGHA